MQTVEGVLNKNVLQQSEEVNIVLCPFLDSLKECFTVTNVHKL